jgi:hypothetical protein
MPILRGIALACALLIALGGGAAAAAPLDVYSDYADNGVIDRDHPTADLLDSLEAARGDAQYGAFAEAVQDALDRQILGRRPPEPPGDGDDDGAAGGAGDLPTPRNPDENGHPPWPFLALTALGGALAVSGAGSSIYRRARRSR